MDIIRQMLIFLLSMLPLQHAAATFFPFTSLFNVRPSFAPQRPYGYRSSRSSPNNNNLIPIQSPIFGLRVYVPRELLNLFNARPPVGPEANYPRPNPFTPPHPNYPHEHRPNGFPQPQPFTPFYAPPNYFPNYSSHPPFDAGSFINFMRALYPDMIYQPDPRYPNVFAIRFPPDHTHLPDSRSLPPQPEFDQQHEQSRFFPGEIPTIPNVNQFLEPPPNLTHNHPPQYNQTPQNQQPQNHLIIIR